MDRYSSSLLILASQAVMSTAFEESSSPLFIDVSIHPDIIKIFQLRAPLSLREFKTFHPP